MLCSYTPSLDRVPHTQLNPTKPKPLPSDITRINHSTSRRVLLVQKSGRRGFCLLGTFCLLVVMVVVVVIKTHFFHGWLVNTKMHEKVTGGNYVLGKISLNPDLINTALPFPEFFNNYKDVHT